MSFYLNQNQFSKVETNKAVIVFLEYQLLLLKNSPTLTPDLKL